MVVTSHSLTRPLQRAVACFRQARVPYALIGAWALAVWGRVRATQDLDFLVLVDDAQLHALDLRLEASGMTRDAAWARHNPLLRGSQIRLFDGPVVIDVLRPRDAQDVSAMRRKRRKRFEGAFYWFVAPEDLILQKLKVGRPRDFEDAMSVIHRCRTTLNRAYLSRWSARIGINEELAYLTSLDHPRR
ncbi:MAG: hypothetical protein ACOYXU_08565 [Nitrospirota bacterium]